MKISFLAKFYGALFIRSFVTASLNNMKAVQFKEFGPADNLYIDNNVPVPQLASSNHLLIRVAATALNRADILQRKGGYAAPKGESEILGLEVSGIVDSVGEDVNDFKIGDKVMALLGGGGYAEYVSVHQYHVMKVPSGLDLFQAAAIPEVWLTSYQLLHFVGALQEGETVLVHAAGSGIGTSVIQLIKAVQNTKVIATAGTSQKLAKAKELGADFIVNYKDEDFSEKVAEFTNGTGANIILDPIGSSNWEKNIKSLSIDGRWVLYGLMGGAKIDGNLLGQMLSKRAQLLASTLRTRSLSYKRDLVAAFQSNCLQKFTNKQFLAIIDSVTTLDNVVEAHKRMESNVSNGKIIMKVSQDDEKSEL